MENGILFVRKLNEVEDAKFFIDNRINVKR